MPPAPVALDLQALQPGSGATADACAQAAGWAAALGRAGRLVAALLAPELPPPPPGAVPAAVPTGLVGWDGAETARRLAATHQGLVRLIPAAWLHTGPRAMADMVPGGHWRRTGVAHAAVVAGPPPAGAVPERVEHRNRWLASAELVLALGAGGGESTGATACGPLPFSQKEWDDLIDRVSPSLDRLTARSPGPYRVALFGPLPPSGGGIGVYNSRFVEASARAGVVVDTVTSAGRPLPGAARILPDAFGADVRPAAYDAVVYTLGNSTGHLPIVEAALRHPGWVWLHEGRLPAVFSSALDGLTMVEYRSRMAHLLELAYPGRAPLAALRRAGRDHIALAEGGVGMVSLLVRRARGIVVNSETARRVVMADLPPRAFVPPIAVIPLSCPPVRQSAGGTAGRGRKVVTFGVVAPAKRPDLLVDAAALGRFDLAFVGPCLPVLREFIEDRAAARGWSDRITVTGEVSSDDWWQWMERADTVVQLRDSTTGESSAAMTDALSAGRPVVTNLPAAADFAPGTVEWLADASPATVASAVNALLDDPERREQMARAAAAYAAAHQFDDLVASFWSRLIPGQR